jgi:hypothetical protein
MQYFENVIEGKANDEVDSPLTNKLGSSQKSDTPNLLNISYLNKEVDGGGRDCMSGRSQSQDENGDHDHLNSR